MNKKTKKEKLKQFDLRVLEVKNTLPPMTLPREYDERLPAIPGVTLFLGRCKSGKTNCAINYLANPEMAGLGRDRPCIFDTIYYCSKTARMDRSTQILFREEYDHIIVYEDTDNLDAFIGNVIDYQNSFPIDDEDNPRPLIAIVMDDISGQLKANKRTVNLFSRYRHANIGQLIVINQDLKSLPTIARSMAENVFIAKTTSIKEREKILEEWGDLYENKLLKAWEYCVDEPYSFCYLKMDKLIPEMYKVSSKGFEKVDWQSFGITLPSQLKNMYKNENGVKNKKSNIIIKSNE